MTIQLTHQELNELQSSFGGETVKLNETILQPLETEGLGKHSMSSGRIANFVYHYITDSITVFKVDEAPPPVEISKINSLIESNEQFRSLLNN